MLSVGWVLHFSSLLRPAFGLEHSLLEESDVASSGMLCDRRHREERVQE